LTKQGRRFFRTVLISTFALAALVWMAMDQFGISRDQMLELLAVTAVLVGFVIAISAATAALWVGLRKLRRRP
jgi:alkylhydroperoxidase/carboxymuconolactone decarboxylase family protein YurZ